MGRLFLLGGLIGAAAGGSQVGFNDLSIILSILGGLGAIGALVTGCVYLFKARGENRLNSVQAMNVLFENQRRVNLDLIAQTDKKIADLQERLRRSDGEQDELRNQLHGCRRERSALQNQVTGLNATIQQLQDEQQAK